MVLIAAPLGVAGVPAAQLILDAPRRGHLVSAGVVAAVLVEMIVLLWYVYTRKFRDRDLHFDSHPLRVVGTIKDDSPRSHRFLAPNDGVPFKRKVLAAWRLAVFFLNLTILVWSLMTDGVWTVVFFTVWNYILQTVYWGSASAASLLHLFGFAVPEWLLRQVNLLHSLCLPMSILVSIVFWGALVPAAVHSGDKQAKLKVFNTGAYFEHAVNTACLLVDFSVNRFLIHGHHLFPMLLWTCFYCIFIWIQHIFTDFWPYFFLELKPIALAWYTAILGVHLIVFGLAHQISRIKKRYVGDIDIHYSGDLDEALLV